ncbi:hypothetical protein MIR68_006061 [Amoeboaphelidium protococcarum]|nr:hypothetical protein MIR68_006061 [Amoeboaphelidium protococcarum]
MSTFQYDSTLPQLPVPPLDQTIAKYLKTVKPFLSVKEFDRVQQVAQDFLQSNIASILQGRLEERSKQAAQITDWQIQYSYFTPDGRDTEVLPSRSGDDNDRPIRPSWLIDWWNMYSYLKYRESVVLNVSFFFVFDYNAFDPITRASLICYHAVKFKQMIIDQSLPPEMVKTYPLSMVQYHYLYNACRIPNEGQDYVEVFDPKQHRYFAVAYHGQYFIVDEVNADGSVYQPEQFAQVLTSIISNGNSSQSSSVGALSSGHRDEWAKNYTILISKKRSEIRKLQSCSFLICLDLDSWPVDRVELSHLCWHNYGINRWFDKSLQFIVFGNGRAGFLGEHSMFDATTPARLCDYICQQSLTYIQQPLQTSDGVKLPSVSPLNIQCPPELSKAVEDSVQCLKQHVLEHDVQVLNYQRYGKGFVKKLLMSPDSFLQMAIQYAYFLMYSSNCATYESAGMKKFQWGRTETCRSVTTESVEFCQAFSDNNVSYSKKAMLFRDAVQTHSKYMVDCLLGHGIDRHFLGLRLSLKENEAMPAFFLDPVYNLSCHWTLSTSQIPSDYFEGYGWGEVVPDGYGVAYMVREDRFMFNIAGLVGDVVPDFETVSAHQSQYFIDNYKNMRVKWFKSCLAQSLDYIYDLFEKQEARDLIPAKSSVAPICPLKPKSEEKDEGRKQAIPVTHAKSEDSIKRVERASSIHSVNSIPRNIGLSLAYPKRAHAKDLYSVEPTGILSDDLGLIDFEIEWGVSYGAQSADSNSSAKDSNSRPAGKRLVKLFKSLMSQSDGNDQL